MRMTDNELFSHLYTLQFTHPFVIVCFEVFHCEIHGMVPLLQINMLPFYRLRKWGWGQLYAGMDWDGDDLETSCGFMGGDRVRVLGMVGDRYKYLFPCSFLVSTLETGPSTTKGGHSSLKVLVNFLHFYPHDANASAGLCDSDVSGRPSVSPSVRHMPVLCLAERKQDHEMYTI